MMHVHNGRLSRWVRSAVCCAAAAQCGGCVMYVPPLSNVDLDTARALTTGVSTADDMKDAFGKPDALDTPEVKVYRAHHDYGFFALVVPGPYVPVGGGGNVGRRDICVVAHFNPDGTLADMDGFITGDQIPPAESVAGQAVFTEDRQDMIEPYPLAFTRLACSDNGRVIVSLDQRERLWVRDDAGRTFVLDSRPLIGHSIRDFAVSHDGRHIALAGKNGAAVVHVQSREPVFHSRDHAAGNQEFTAVAISSDMDLVAVPTKGPLLRWNARSGQRLNDLTPPGKHRPRHVAFSVDGQRIAADMNGEVAAAVWSAADGAVIATLPDRPTVETGGIAFVDRGGTRVAIAHSSHVEVHQLSMQSPGGTVLEQVVPLPPGHDSSPRIAADPGTGRIAVVDRGVMVIDPQRRMLIGELAGVLGQTTHGIQAFGDICAAEFGRNGMIICTDVGVFEATVIGGHDLRLDQQWLDRW